VVNSAYHPREFFKDMWTTIASGKVWRDEIRNRAKDGSFYWVDTTIVPFLDDSGKPYQYIAIRHDITERKRLEAELLRAAQLSLIGELAAGLAHEVKNPLAGIQGAVDILIRRRQPSDPEREALEGVREEVARIDATVRALLDRARPRAMRPANASFPDAVRRAVLLAQDHALATAPMHGRAVSVELESVPEPFYFAFDHSQIEDAVLNLALNAIEAAAPEGRVVVRVRRDERGRTGGPEAVVEIEDNGRGISADDLAKIFNPFFTTTPGGTGLGLPAVRRIARAHGGRVDVRSEVGKGSVFTIRVPM
jgi:signal transduction histidine kinase